MELSSNKLLYLPTHRVTLYILDAQARDGVIRLDGTTRFALYLYYILAYPIFHRHFDTWEIYRPCYLSDNPLPNLLEIRSRQNPLPS